MTSGAPVAVAPSVRPRSAGRYVALRLLQMVPTLLLILVTAFLLLKLAPGDAAQVLAGDSGGGDAAYLDTLRQRFGLDQPIAVQLLLYARNVLTGELGFSFRNNMPVAALIVARVVPTLLLTGIALLVAVLLGVAGGVTAALTRGRLADRLIGAVALLLYATPGFLLGIGLMILFGVVLLWLPTGGYADANGAVEGWAHAGSVARHLVLPVVTLGMLYAAIYSRFTRSAMIEIYAQDYIRTARAKGLGPARIAWRHGVRNALLPLVTIIGLQAGSLLSGAIVVETVFAWPGLGRLAFEAVQQRDYNLLSGLVLCTGALVVITNLIVDLLYATLDPRVRLR